MHSSSTNIAGGKRDFHATDHFSWVCENFIQFTFHYPPFCGLGPSLPSGNKLHLSRWASNFHFRRKMPNVFLKFNSKIHFSSAFVKHNESFFLTWSLSNLDGQFSLYVSLECVMCRWSRARNLCAHYVRVFCVIYARIGLSFLFKVVVDGSGITPQKSHFGDYYSFGIEEEGIV